PLCIDPLARRAAPCRRQQTDLLVVANGGRGDPGGLGELPDSQHADVNIHRRNLLLPFKLLEGVRSGHTDRKGTIDMDQTTQTSGGACCESCGTGADQDTALAIACTLDAG